MSTNDFTEGSSEDLPVKPAVGAVDAAVPEAATGSDKKPIIRRSGRSNSAAHIAQTTEANRTKFIEMLRGSSPLLADFVRIIEEFAKLQGKPTSGVPVNEDSGPPTMSPIGGAVPYAFLSGITQNELKWLQRDKATAIVKAKALEYAKGFIAGAMFAM